MKQGCRETPHRAHRTEIRRGEQWWGGVWTAYAPK